MTHSAELLSHTVRDTVATPLTAEQGAALFSLSRPLADAVSVQAETSENDAYYVFPNHNTLEGYIHMALGHVSANPSSRKRTLLLERMYVYPDGGQSVNDTYVNENSATASHFLECLKREALEEHAVYGTLQKRRKDVHIVSGARGIGKTCFVNHLFTIHNSSLSKDGYVWIRLHLPDDYGGDTPNLAHWLRSKIALVLLRYYSGHHSMAGFIEGVRKRLAAKSDPALLADYRKNVDAIQEAFSRASGEALAASTVDELVGKTIVDEAHTRQLKFIFVLDGFDKIDITSRFERRFIHLLSEMRRLFTRDTKLNGAFVVVCRKRTLTYFTGAPPYGTESQTNKLFWKLKFVPFEAIIRRRIELIKKVVPTIASEETWGLESWNGLLDEFESTWTEMLAPSGLGGDAIQNVDAFYGDNNRAKSQLIQLAFYNFLVARAERRRYVLVEAMATGGYKYPPRVYQYVEDERHQLVPETVTKLFDNVFLPTIFAFPYANGHVYRDVPAAGTYLLCPLRVMQSVAAYELITHEHKLGSSMPMELLARLLRSAFNYEEDVTFKVCQELCEFGVFALEGEGVLFPKRRNQVTIRPLPKLSGLVGFGRGVLSEVAFLNLCAMRTLIDRNSLDPAARIPYFRATSLKTSSGREWRKTKVMNAISMLRMIAHLDEAERRTAFEYLEQPSTIAHHRDVLAAMNLAGVVPRLLGHALRQLGSICNEMNDSEQLDLQRTIRSYQTHWCSSSVP